MIRGLFHLSFVGMVLIIFCGACNEPTDLAAFLEEDDRFEVMKTDLPVTARTEEGETVVTYNDSIGVPAHFIGQIDEPVFGRYSSALHFQARAITEPDFTRASLDSVVLSLAIDTTRAPYGNQVPAYGFDVFRLQTDLDRSINYRSDAVFEHDAEPIASYLGEIPGRGDTLMVIEARGENVDTFSYAPHIRIVLDEAPNKSGFGRELLDFEVSDFASNEIFLAKLKGFSVVPTQGEGMVYLDMDGGLTRLNLYYHIGDTAYHETFPVTQNSVIVSTYETDYTGAEVEQALNAAGESDSLVYLHSMDGVNVVLEIGDIAAIENTTINHASLDVTVTGVDTGLYAPIQQLILFQRRADGELAFIKDVADSFGFNNFDLLFGGDVRTDDDGRVFYRMNVTEHLQQIVLGAEASTTLVLANSFRASQPARTILFGSGHPSLAAKLSVTHTSTIK